MFRFIKSCLWARARDAQRSTSRAPRNAQRDDAGFSFAQVIVTMVIVGILGGAIGFTAFQFIGQSRETVLAANIRTAADAVQNSLALNPNLKTPADVATGQPSAALISELSNVAGFTWSPGSTYSWAFQTNDGVETVRIQMIAQDNDDANAAGATSGTVAPIVRWLVGDGDAVRVQIQNEDNAWACALIVLRPNWSDTLAGATAGTVTSQIQATTEGNLRGIWYDAGTNILEDGFHHCSPTTVENKDLSTAAEYGNTTAADNAPTAHNDPLPLTGSTWNINFDADDNTTASTSAIPARTLERAVPDFAAS